MVSSLVSLLFKQRSVVYGEQIGGGRDHHNLGSSPAAKEVREKFRYCFSFVPKCNDHVNFLLHLVQIQHNNMYCTSQNKL